MWLLMLDFEEAVVPSVLYIWLVKREGVLHCTQNKKNIPHVWNGLLHVNIMTLQIISDTL